MKKERLGKKESHPELQKGEILLTNSTLEGFSQIGWKTKRMGEIAYDIYGKSINGLFPVFVQQSEIGGVRQD